MSEPTLQEVAIQKSLELTDQEVLKVLSFIAGMEAGKAAKENNARRRPEPSIHHEVRTPHSNAR